MVVVPLHYLYELVSTKLSVVLDFLEPLGHQKNQQEISAHLDRFRTS